MDQYNNQQPVQDFNNGGNGGQGGPGLAIASMILGIVSIIVSCCFYYLSIPLALVGLILAIVAIKKQTRGKGMAVTGLVLSIIALAFAIIVVVTAGALLASLGLDSFM